MQNKTPHEPDENVMDAEEVWDDARELAGLLRQNLSQTEPVVRLQIPLSALLAAVDELNQEELRILKEHVEERLIS